MIPRFSMNAMAGAVVLIAKVVLVVSIKTDSSGMKRPTAA
jgi:hypothetical protein